MTTSTQTLTAVCAHCERDHGISHTREERITHGICRRHALEFIRDSGLRPEQAARAIKQLEANPSTAPDLGPIPVACK